MSRSGIDLTHDPFLTHTPVNTNLDPQRTAALNSRRATSPLHSKYSRSKFSAGIGVRKGGSGWMFATGAAIPTCMFVGLIALYTFDWVVPSFVWALVLLLFVLFVYVAWPPPPLMDMEGNPMQPRSAWLWFPTGSLIIATTLGLLFGGVNYHIFMTPYLRYSFQREYTNVNPGEDSQGFQDSGALYFASSARLNLAQSVGFKEWNRYCVAPIVSDNPSDTIGFFAAGLDCCNSRHDFNCWDAKDPTAHAGVRISEFDAFGRHNPQWKKAAAMAASVYGFRAADDPVIVMWVKDPHRFAESTFWFAMIFLMLSAVAAFLGMCCCVTTLSKLRAF